MCGLCSNLSPRLSLVFWPDLSNCFPPRGVQSSWTIFFSGFISLVSLALLVFFFLRLISEPEIDDSPIAIHIHIITVRGSLGYYPFVNS